MWILKCSSIIRPFKQEATTQEPRLKEAFLLNWKLSITEVRLHQMRRKVLNLDWLISVVNSSTQAHKQELQVYLRVKEFTICKAPKEYCSSRRRKGWAAWINLLPGTNKKGRTFCSPNSIRVHSRIPPGLRRKLLISLLSGCSHRLRRGARDREPKRSEN